MISPIRACLASLGLIVAFPVCADLTGKVVVMAGGHTITVLRDREQVKVRLAEIDAQGQAVAFPSVFQQDRQAGQQGRGSLSIAPVPFSGLPLCVTGT